MRRFALWQLVDVLVGIGVVAVAVTQMAEGIGVVAVAAFVLSVSLGAVIVNCFWLIITIGAFWVVRMEHVAELFNGLYQAGRWPVTIYPSWLRITFTVLVPLAFAVTVPAEALTGRPALTTVALAAGFTTLVAGFTRWFWRLGLRNYSGASA